LLSFGQEICEIVLNPRVHDRCHIGLPLVSILRWNDSADFQIKL